MLRSITGAAATGTLIMIILLLIPATVQGQQRISLQAALDTALQHNLQLRASELQLQRSRALTGSWLDLPRTGLFVENEDLRPSDRVGILKIGVSQGLEWPGVYGARRRLLQRQMSQAEASRQLRGMELSREVEQVYYRLWYLQSRQALWQRLDSIYASLANAAMLRVRTGESAGLDSIAALARAREISMERRLLDHDMMLQQQQLGLLLQTTASFLPPARPMERVQTRMLPSDSLPEDHPYLRLQQTQTAIAEAELSLQRRSRLPSLEGRFFSQRLYGLDDPFTGFSVSLGIPLSGVHRARVRAAGLEQRYQQALAWYEQQALQTRFSQARGQLHKDLELLNYYEHTALAQAEAILSAAQAAYRAGEISYAALSQYMTQAIDIHKSYLDALHQYNQSAIALNYYVNY